MNYELPPGSWSTGAEYVVRVCPNPDCPSHKKGRKNKLYWNVTKAKGICFSCHMIIHGWIQFSKLFGVTAPMIDFSGFRDSEASWLDCPALWYLPAWDDPISRNYLIGRGVQEAQARRAGFYWIAEERSIALVSDPLSLELVPEVVHRSILPTDYKWIPRPGGSLSRQGFGLDWLPEGRPRTVVLMEGIFDVLAGAWEGVAVGLYGSRLSECWLAWLQQTKTRPILWFDPDEGGDQGVREAVESLEAASIPHAVYSRNQHPKDLRYWDPDLPGVKLEIAKISEELLCL